MHRRSVIAGLAALTLTPPARAKSPWRPLWNGRSLDGWTRLGDAAWTIDNGILACDHGPISYLVSNESFADFQLRVDFWVSDNANSGIFIRCTNPAEVTVTNSYEVNIFEQRPDQRFATGAIVGVAPIATVPKTGGRWNRMDITAKGDRFTVLVNGQRTVDKAADPKHPSGRITLQYGTGVVKFRSVKVLAI
ncbi:hypothetical protein CHU93_09405 [Sandarakinorhabdus cyanobacteriorum]|uniref:3-keto-alpha-glucoside-1,2-lyase/3-keto-2-hydroxy-glucal hydratase domain-containing protein n=1 Tax=Sandarakinorhabdus cyanobacteriorum TaxID=1981098 RepID=A0A255YGC9_9SPHN|nr:DUF1080 domain-containing protein [Sandarakinorhabdus cyanobacteriorum]OYQ28317.1 hypothetical protein CHU93_09405 [Sandarakinorhabdus cyanobacteriorum]